MTNLAAIVALLALNGFFVAAEFSLVKARGLRLSNLAAEGSAAARLTLQIQANLEGYLATCQLGITMASLGLGWAGEPAVAALLKPAFTALGMPAAVLHSSALVLGFLLFASLHIVIGNQLARTVAIRRAEQVSLWVAYPLHGAYLMMRPLNWLLSRTSQVILSIFKFSEAAREETSSDAELNSMARVTTGEDKIEHSEIDLLHNLSEFDQRCVACMMTPRKSVNVLDVATSPAVNKRVLMECGHSRLPLIDSSNGDELLGIVSTLVIYQAIIAQQVSPWQQLATYSETPLTVLEQQHIAQLFDLMRTRHQRITCVVNENGSLCGIVAMADLLEEIVGDI